MTVHWKDQALCKGSGTAQFFPERGEPFKYPEVCKTCPVQQQCLEAGLSEYHGIWGGRSEKQRRAMRRERGYDIVLRSTAHAS